METSRNRWLDLALGGEMTRGGGCLSAFGYLDDRLFFGLHSMWMCLRVCVFADAVAALLFLTTKHIMLRFGTDQI